MGAHYQILMPLLSLFLVRVDLTDLFPLKVPVEVLKIYDGDTVLLRHNNYLWKLRFSKIDSPEKGQPFFRTRIDAGLVSLKCLEGLLQKEKKLFAYIEKEDIYGRLLGDLNYLSYKLIENGCTTIYPYAVFGSKKEKNKYFTALKKAKAQRVGLWRYGGFKRPMLWRRANKRNGVRR